MLNEGYIINNTYRIIRPIGKGGTGIIYLAEHLHLRKMVVLKRIKDSLSGAIAVRQEADILKSLHHMYLPQVYDFLEYDSGVYTVIDYVNGRDMQYYIDNNIYFTEEQIVGWMLQLCDALEYLHSHNPPIYHNDIKPANIIIGEDSKVCLIDFNVSTDAQQIVCGFTAEYSSPEQYYKVLSLTGAYPQTDITVGVASDLYSLGVSMYVLSSHFPTSVYDVISGTQPKFSLLGTTMSDGFRMIIDKLTDPDPGRRFESAAALRKALKALKKQDARYKKYLLMQICTIFLSGFLVLSGIWFVYSGLLRMQTDKFEQRYTQLCTAYNSEAYVDSVDIGYAILSNRDWKSLIDDYKLAKIYHIVGMSLYYSGDYTKADEYLYDSVKAEDDAGVRAGYEMDYSVVLAEQKRFDEASQWLSEAVDDGLSGDNIELTHARIEYAKGNYDAVIDRYYSSDPSVADAGILSKIQEVTADAYLAQNNYAEAIKLYQQAYSSAGGIVVARKLAAAYVRLSDVQELSVNDRCAYLESAAGYYETLASNDYHSAEDMINLGKVYRLMGNLRNSSSDYNNSISVLNRASEEFSDDYRIYIQLAFSYFKLGDDQQAAAQCVLADKYYNNSAPSGEGSDEMIEYQELKRYLGV